MSEGKERPAPKSWLSETVVLFLAPALAYFLAFKYEEGYCGTFGVPAYLIKPDLTEILIFTSVSMGYSIWLFWIVDSWLDMGERNTDPHLRSWQHLMGRYFPLFTVFIFFIILYAEFWQKWIWFLSVFPILLGLDVLYAFFATAPSPKDKSFIERLATTNPWADSSGIFFRMRSRTGRAGAVLLGLILLGSLLARSIGNSEALRQTSFLVPSSNTNSIVVRCFGDKMICVLVDPRTKKPRKSLFLLSPGSDGNLQFNLKETGQLKF